MNNPSIDANIIRQNRPKSTNRKVIVLLVIFLLTLGICAGYLTYKNSLKYRELQAIQNSMQQALDNNTNLQENELNKMAQDIHKLRQEQAEFIPKQLQDQYDQILKKLELLSHSNNTNVASVASNLLLQLSNQAGSGISVGGPNNTNISNSGVISINNATGNISIQGTPNQTTVTQNGSTTTIGTTQDIAPSSNPTFSGLQISGTTNTNTLSINSSGTQNGYAICDASNNCGYSGAGSSFVQGGNSFGNPANIGTNDTQPLNVETNGVTRLSIDAIGNSTFTGNVSSSGTISANNLSGDGSGVTNVDATALNGNTAGNSNGQIAINNGTVNTNLNADLLDGQSGSYYQNASNISSGTLADARLSGNVTLQGNSFNGANQLVQLTGAGALPVLNGSALTNINAVTLAGQSGSYYQNASNINTGALSDSRLSSNVPLKNAINTFTNTNNFAGITSTGILQGGYQVCDASNNCNYATSAQFANAILQGGNSFGTQMTIGTNDNQSLAMKTNGSIALTILQNGDTSIGTNSDLGQLGVESTASNKITLVVKKSASQSVSMQEWQANNGSTLVRVDNWGSIQGFGTGGFIAYNQLQARGNAQPYITLGNGGSGSAGYEWAFTSNGRVFELRGDHTNANPTWPRLYMSVDNVNGTLSKYSIDPTAVSMIIQGASGQTANLQEWRNSSNEVVASLNSIGNTLTLGKVSTTDPSSTITLRGSYNSGSTTLTINSGGSDASIISSGSSNALDIGTNSFHGLMFRASGQRVGQINLQGMRIGGASGNPAGQLDVNNQSASRVGAVIRGFTGQIANLQEWRNSSGTSLLSVSASGVLNAPGQLIMMEGNGGNTRIGSATQHFSHDNGKGTLRSTDTVAWLQFTTSQALGNGFRLVGSDGASDGDFVMYSSENFFQQNTIERLRLVHGGVSGGALQVRGVSGQTANLQEWMSSSGTVLAKIDASGNLTVKNATVEGAYITFSNNIRGYNVPITASTTSQSVTFSTPHSDTNYAVFCTPDWDTTCYVNNKTVNGFTLNFGTAAPASQKMDWFVAR
ncbi:MAG: hypothetical protein H6793_00120 [Candidatus Nomurabacteria bacterium]|nr:MAG: hypothetical protein H6793_00120 [Candidatus Nomurabacteria bacterium]